MSDDFIQPEQLVELLSSMTLGKDLLIVDVRNDDREVGWIKGSVNLPSQSLNADVLASFLQSVEGDATLVVFHCFFSQVRGPAARRMFEELPPTASGRKPRSAVLRGGYDAFERYAAQRCPDVLDGPVTQHLAKQRATRSRLARLALAVGVAAVVVAVYIFAA